MYFTENDRLNKIEQHQKTVEVEITKKKLAILEIKKSTKRKKYIV
jgi:hypothetical protein